MIFSLVIIFFGCLLMPELSHARKPIVIAHRGASGYLPEHTLESKSAALVMGSDYIEQDVVLTRDDVPIVLHDIYLDEVTDVARKFPTRFRMENNERRYLAIDFDLAEIRTLQATERFHRSDANESFFSKRFPEWQSRFHLHTLEDEIQLIKGYEKSYNTEHKLYEQENHLNKTFGIYVEIKRPDFYADENKANFSRIVLDVIEKYYLNDKESKVIIQCFDPAETKRIRNQLGSQFFLVQLLENKEQSNGINYTYWNSREGLEEISGFADGIGPHIKQLVSIGKASDEISPSRFHKNAKDLDLILHPYTFRIDQVPAFVSSYKDLLSYCINELEVDGVFTDFPDVTIDFISMNSQSNSNKLKASYTISFIALFYFFLFKN